MPGIARTKDQTREIRTAAPAVLEAIGRHCQVSTCLRASKGCTEKCGGRRRVVAAVVVAVAVAVAVAAVVAAVVVVFVAYLHCAA